MTRPANCLNFDFDLERTELFDCIGEVFRVKLSDVEAARCQTVGELFDVVSSRLNISEARNLPCPTALAFFRLRAALRRLGYEQRMTTRTDLRAIFRKEGIRRLYTRLPREEYARCPPRRVSCSTAFRFTPQVRLCWRLFSCPRLSSRSGSSPGGNCPGAYFLPTSLSSSLPFRCRGRFLNQ